MRSASTVSISARRSYTRRGIHWRTSSQSPQPTISIYSRARTSGAQLVPRIYKLILDARESSDGRFHGEERGCASTDNVASCRVCSCVGHADLATVKRRYSTRFHSSEEGVLRIDGSCGFVLAMSEAVSVALVQ